MIGRILPLFLLTCMALIFAGASCEKMSPDQKLLLSTAASAATERAKSFAVIKTQIKPKDASQQLALKVLLDAHSGSLNSQAAALNDFLEGVTNGKGLTDQARDAIIETAKNAQARREDFAALQKHLDLDEAQKAWVETHIKVLTQQSKDLSDLAEKIKPTKAEPPATGPPAEK